MQKGQDIVNRRNELISEICTERRAYKIEDVRDIIKMHFRSIQYEISSIFIEINNLNNERLKV